MARRLRTEANSLYGTPQPLSTFDLIPVTFKRAPTTGDLGFTIGQLWWDSVGAVEYVLTAQGGGIATWTAIASNAGAVFTVTGDAGGALAPGAGNISVVGDGVNITTSGAGSTITVNESATPTFTSVTTGAIDITTGGAADTAGKTTLVGGTKTVATTAVTASSLIFVTVQALGTVVTPMAMTIDNVVAGASFDITSSDVTDTSVVAWMIIEPV